MSVAGSEKTNRRPVVRVFGRVERDTLERCACFPLVHWFSSDLQWAASLFALLLFGGGGPFQVNYHMCALLPHGHWCLGGNQQGPLGSRPFGIFLFGKGSSNISSMDSHARAMQEFHYIHKHMLVGRQTLANGRISRRVRGR